MSSDLPRDYLDRILNTLFERAPATLLQLALGDPHLVVRQILGGKRVLLRRDLDSAAIIETEHGPCVGHVEFETDADPRDLPARVALYGTILHVQTGLPVRSAVVVLERGPEIPVIFNMAHGPDLISSYHFRVVPLYQIPAATLAADPNLAVLAPLGQGATLDDVAAAKATLNSTQPRAERADLMAALYIVGGRRFSLPLLRRILSEEELMESVTYRDIIEKGIEKGRKEGIEKGMPEGRRLGLRVFVERLLGRRFPEAAAELGPLLDGLSADDLEAVGEAVLTAPSAEQMRVVIEGVREGR